MKQLHQKIVVTLGLNLLAIVASPAQILVSAGGPAYTQNFNGFTTAATNPLPSGFVGDLVSAANATDFSYTAQDVETATRATLPNPNTNYGMFNFGNGSTPSTSTDRALGVWISSGNYALRGQTAAIMAQFQNAGSLDIASISLTYDLGKYRFGTVASSVDLFYSLDGSNWLEVGGIFSHDFAPDPTNNQISSPPNSLVTISSTFTPAEAIAAGQIFYLAWRYTADFAGVTGTQNAAAIGLDNISLTAVPEPGTVTLFLTAAFAAAFACVRRRAS
jgi:hypothetical protein